MPKKKAKPGEVGGAPFETPGKNTTSRGGKSRVSATQHSVVDKEAAKMRGARQKSKSKPKSQR
jgi:hypothetical protein